VNATEARKWVVEVGEASQVEVAEEASSEVV
jgi:hypothetical protein